MADAYAGVSPIFGPVSKGVAITPNDGYANGTVAMDVTKKLYTGSGLTMTVVNPDGTNTAYANVPAGQWWDLRIVGVMATGTTATGLVAGY